ncbi:MAG TPA: LPS export ABC transporter permease LptG [Steroidobacteraceae bacterium]|nr:LPS export ABC transporter permease LptG [Steroidobacteraceae bacterium]
MRVFAAYIVRAVLGYTAMVMLVLLMLIGLYMFVDQQSDVGTGRYGMLEALLFVICNLPDQAFTLLPVGALLGALLALGNLARGSELIAMRASGASVWRIASWVASAGLILTVVTWVVGDYVAPQLEQFAYQQRMLAKFNQFKASGAESLWAKDGNVFVAVQAQHSADSYGAIHILRFDDQHKLLSVGHADSAQLLDTQRWQLRNYSETRFENDHTIVSKQASAELKTSLSPEFIGAASRDPYQLTGTELRSFIRHLRSNQLETRDYEIAWWSRIARTTSLLIIVMLAVPFSFGPMRSTGMGARMVVGILLGSTFFLSAKLLSDAGTVFHLQPLIVAWLPTALLLLVTSIAISRVR